MRAPTFHGLPKRMPMQGAFAEKFSYHGTFSGVPILFDGGICTLKFIVDEMNTLGQVVQEITERLAASFAPACIVPLEIISMSGTISGVPFTVGLDGFVAQIRPCSGQAGARVS
jgi:hypothetical protein